MKLIRFKLNSEINYGFLEGNTVTKVVGDPFENYEISNEKYYLNNLELLHPVDFGKIIGIGINYYDFVESIKMPIPKKPYVFYKPNTTLIKNNEEICLPNMNDLVTFEGELAVVIKKQGKNIEEDKALNYVLGYSIANDVTNKKDFLEDGHMGIAKSYDTFTPVANFIEMGLNNEELSNLKLIVYQNEEIKQNGNTKDLIFTVPYLISYLSKVMTLMPGDIILTGTPVGPGPVKSGDIIRIEIEKIGSLTNIVK